MRYNFERILKIACYESKTKDVEGEILTRLRKIDLDCIHFLRYSYVFLRMLDPAQESANGLLDPITSWMCWTQQFEAIDCFYPFCPSQELRPSLTEEDIQRESKKGELDAFRRHYIQEQAIKVIEMWECERLRLYKTANTVEQNIREHFPYRRSLAVEQLLEEIKEGKLFGYLQCDFEVPE